MKNKVLIIITLVLFVFLSFFSARATEILKNAGFIRGKFWFSKPEFFSGETIRIYTVIYNGSEKDIKGTIEFYDFDKLIGKDNFSVLNQNTQVIWTDAVFNKGTHKISIKLTNTFGSLPGENDKPIILEFSELSEETGHEIFVDSDTDGDKIGDLKDVDDDNDGITDIEEIKLGTNPLESNLDKDRVSEGEEVKLSTPPLNKDKVAKEKAEGVIPEKTKGFIPYITETAKKAVKKLEKFRKEKLRDIEIKIEKEKKERKKIDEIKKKIDEIKIEKEKKEIKKIDEELEKEKIISQERESPAIVDKIVKSPFQTLKILFFSIIKYLLKYKILFYVGITILIYCIVKFIYNLIFKK